MALWPHATRWRADDKTACHNRCPAFSVERELLFNNINKVYKGIDALDDNGKLNVILASADKTVIWALGYYINICFKKRLIARSH